MLNNKSKLKHRTAWESLFYSSPQYYKPVVSKLNDGGHYITQSSGLDCVSSSKTKLTSSLQVRRHACSCSRNYSSTFLDFFPICHKITQTNTSLAQLTEHSGVFTSSIWSTSQWDELVCVYSVVAIQLKTGGSIKDDILRGREHRLEVMISGQNTNVPRILKDTLSHKTIWMWVLDFTFNTSLNHKMVNLNTEYYKSSGKCARGDKPPPHRCSSW